MIAWSRDAVQIARRLFEQNLGLYRTFGRFDASTLGLVRADGAMDLYHGGLRARDADGNTMFDHVDYDHYWERIIEDVKPWSLHEVPVLHARWARTTAGTGSGRWRACTQCDCIPTPLAEQERQEFLAFGDGARGEAPRWAIHWARMIEMLHAAEAIEELLQDPDIRAPTWWRSGERQARGVGVIEAPRGTLIHHYRVDEDDQVDARQPDRLHHPQQPGDERGDPRGARRSTSTAASSPKAC